MRAQDDAPGLPQRSLIDTGHGGCERRQRVSIERVRGCTDIRRSPIRRYPDLVVHRALLRELGASDDPAPPDIGELAEHTSVREREAAEIEHAADDICLAWLLERELFERGWDEPWEGEIIGAIPSGLFVRFGDVFEGYLPARRMPGDYFELNTLGTALAGRRSGGTYRLGDPISVRVEEIRRWQGEVEVSLADRVGR